MPPQTLLIQSSITGKMMLAILSLMLLLGQHNTHAKALRTLEQNYDDDYYAPALDICDDLIVQVTSISTVCDSPQTFYYGSSVNRNSITCNFGDKATTTVYFDVTEDLYDTTIYVVMSVYAGYGNSVLTSTSPKNIKKYVGYSCDEAGSYSFTYSNTLGSSSSTSSYGSFVPFIQIAFSSETNGDYNLGAANIPCQWDDREFGEWTEVTAKSSSVTTRDFFMEYGILVATVVSCLAFVAVFAKVTQARIRRVKSQQRNRIDGKSSALVPPPPDATSA